MKNHGRRMSPLPSRSLVLRSLSAAILMSLALSARATTTVKAGTTTQTLSTDTSYVLNSGTTVSATSGDTLDVNGIAPATFTNAGSILNLNGSSAALNFNVSGSVINQATGAIEGQTYGIRTQSGTLLAVLAAKVLVDGQVEALLGARQIERVLAAVAHGRHHVLRGRCV
jgi:hypothetical protein